ncbi:MAG: hypothetical protein QW666_02540 [Candidatus Woesearchaeota archaeon]
MALIERTYIIPLRKEWLKVPKYKRAKKAVTAVKQFLKKHLKVKREVRDDYSDILLGRYLNLELWHHGIRNPPSRIKVTVQKDDKGIVRAELFGKPIVVEKKEERKEKGLAEKLKEKVTGKEEKPKIVREELKAGAQEGQEEKRPEEKEVKPVQKKEVKFEEKHAKQPKPAPAKKPVRQEIR